MFALDILDSEPTARRRDRFGLQFPLGGERGDDRDELSLRFTEQELDMMNWSD